MTRVQFCKKLKPAVKNWLDAYRKDGKKAVRAAFSIVLVNELMWRLGDEVPDDKVDDDPFFDKVDSKWFLKEFLFTVSVWEEPARLLLGDDDGYTTYVNILNEIKDDWEAMNGNEEGKAAEAGR